MTIQEMEQILLDYASEEGLTWRSGIGLPYLHYIRGESSVTLDGDFSATELEAITIFINLNRKS